MFTSTFATAENRLHFRLYFAPKIEPIKNAVLLSLYCKKSVLGTFLLSLPKIFLASQSAENERFMRWREKKCVLV